jgi:hypothetical protein
MELIALKQSAAHVLSKQLVVRQIVQYWIVQEEFAFSQIVANLYLFAQQYAMRHV